jgi:hypothetical protein
LSQWATRLALLVAAGLCTDATGQDSRPAFDFAAGQALLSDVRDGSFSFDEPAFYWLARRVKFADPDSAFDITEDEVLVPWKYLLERPSDYRGQLVLIEGSLARKYAWTSQGLGYDLGQLHQAELFDPRSRGFCTVVCIEPLDNVPVNAWVRGKGYFLKVRQFQTADGAAGYAPLLVARRLAAVQQPISVTDSVRWSTGRWGGLAWGATLLALLLGGWWVLRRHARSVSPPRLMQQHRRPADQATLEGPDEPDLPDEIPPSQTS